MRGRRWLAALLTLLWLLVLAAPAYAKGGGFSGGGSRGGFSSGGSRGSFSSSGSRSFSPSPSPSRSSGSFSTGSGRSFSTPNTSPSKNYTVGRSYSGGSGSYSSGSGAYSSGSGYSGVNGVPSGSGRSVTPNPRPSYAPIFGQGSTGSPYFGRPPVIIYSHTPLPYDPWYYHSWYWGMPWYSRLFWGPTYYSTPWGYHYFEPNYFTWTVLGLVLLFGGLWAWGWWRMRRW